MKVILLSDSHTNYAALEIVRDKYRDADLMVHCGDCLLKPEKMKGFLAVHGNLDNPRELPLEETFDRVSVFHIRADGKTGSEKENR